MSSLRAVDYQVQAPPNHGEAVGFLRRVHYAKGAANTSTYRHGLYGSGVLVSDLLGVALWMPPTRSTAEAVCRDAPWTGVLALTRLALREEVPTNGASFLLGRSMRLIDRSRWPVLLTYADTAEGHTGAIYRATNWECEGLVPAGDTWVDKHGRQVGRKRGGRTLTVAEMVAAGYTKKPSAPKWRFTHRVASPRARQVAA